MTLVELLGLELGAAADLEDAGPTLEHICLVRDIAQRPEYVVMMHTPIGMHWRIPQQLQTVVLDYARVVDGAGSCKGKLTGITFVLVFKEAFLRSGSVCTSISP